MGFPILMLFVMLGKSVSLVGSHEGIKHYLTSDFSVLVENPEVWPKAVSQIFFSIGITFGKIYSSFQLVLRPSHSILS